MAPRTVLRPDAILTATEDVLRKHGPQKATVVDVARELGVSHAAVYQHFASKRELREAVARRWLDADLPQLEAIATDSARPAPERLRDWLHAVLEVKQDRLRRDPELFEAFVLLVAAQSAVATEHEADLMAQVVRIVSDGMADGTFGPGDASRTARSIFHATAPFNHVAHSGHWLTLGIGDDLDAVCTLVLDGLRPRADDS